MGVGNSYDRFGGDSTVPKLSTLRTTRQGLSIPNSDLLDGTGAQIWLWSETIYPSGKINQLLS